MVSRKTAYGMIDWINAVSSPDRLFDRLGGNAMRRCLIVRNKLDQVGPIILANCTLRRNLDEPFVQATRAALKLIERYDPRRFRVVEQEFGLIVNQHMASDAAYQRSTRQCKVSFTSYWVDEGGNFCADPQAKHYEWYLARYASMLVHESTHGKLDSLHFPYTKKTRVRIERICVSEQRRFLARLPQDSYDLHTIVSPFDVQRWEALWNMGYWERFKRIMQSVRERQHSS